MQITTNTTPFLSELFVSTDKHGQKHCVTVVKATLEVDASGTCKPAGEQEDFVYSDEHHGNPGTTSIKYESDFAPVKPRADVLVNAQAIAPAGKAVTELGVTLKGPGFIKSMKITGDRKWEDRFLGIRPSKPLPFETMPIIWERAFGGADLSHKRDKKKGCEIRNPVGVGYHLNSNEKTIVGKALPNIEKVGASMRKWSDKCEPIGFGPLGRGWQPRISFAGTYDQQWMDEKLPFLPEDFDDQYFQSAPVDQQLPKLSGRETFICHNMSEDAEFVVQLPFFEVPVRFLFDSQTKSLRVKPDTLIIEPGAKRVIMLGRVSVPLPRKFTTLREIQVGKSKRQWPAHKPHYKILSEAITALRGRR